MIFLLTTQVQNPNNWSTFNVIGRFFSIILAIVFVMALAYYATRMIAGARYTSRGKANLKLIEGANVGYQANVQLVQAGEKYILIGVTRERVSYLAEIPKEQIAEPENVLPGIPFEKYLRAYRKGKLVESEIEDEGD